MTDGACLREKETLQGHCESLSDWMRGDTSVGVGSTYSV